MTLRVFITGGTFDKEYDEIDGKLYFKDTHLPEMLKSGRSRLDIEITTLMLKDSLDITPEERQHIVDNVKKAKESDIVITHGTDTMVETAKLLAGQVKDKTIVLTGAMIPIRFGSSDGLFNLGSSLAFAQVLPPGVYISMNGKYFRWNNVRKNRELGLFEEL